MDMDKLRERIRTDAGEGIDFGCSCSSCGASPIDLVKRGDCIPVLYGSSGRFSCYRCSEERYYV